MACQCDNGVVIKPDGVNELIPGRFVEKEIHHNVTVVVSQCKYCGEMLIEWYRQDDTEDQILAPLDDIHNE